MHRHCRPGDVELLRASREIALLMPFVRLMKRPERVAEKTVLGAAGAGRGHGAEVMRAFIVVYEKREAVRIVEAVDVRTGNRAGKQAQQNENCDRALPPQDLRHQSAHDTRRSRQSTVVSDQSQSAVSVGSLSRQSQSAVSVASLSRQS